MKMNTKKVLAISGAAAVTLLMAVPVFAATATTTTSSTRTHMVRGPHKFNGVIGTVASIDGSTLTITSEKGTTYSVNAAAATLKKGFGKEATAITLSNIAVNDHVAVEGTVTGMSVAATSIHDGVRAARAIHKKLENAAFGTVASVTGNTFTLTHKTKTGSATRTVTTTSTTTYKKNGIADTAADIVPGDHVVVMGAKDTSGNVTAATSVNLLVRKAKAATT